MKKTSILRILLGFNVGIYEYYKLDIGNWFIMLSRVHYLFNVKIINGQGTESSSRYLQLVMFKRAFYIGKTWINKYE